MVALLPWTHFEPFVGLRGKNIIDWCFFTCAASSPAHLSSDVVVNSLPSQPVDKFRKGDKEKGGEVYRVECRAYYAEILQNVFEDI